MEKIKKQKIKSIDQHLTNQAMINLRSQLKAIKGGNGGGNYNNGQIAKVLKKTGNE